MLLWLTYWMPTATVLVSVASKCRPSLVWFSKRSTRQPVDLAIVWPTWTTTAMNLVLAVSQCRPSQVWPSKCRTKQPN